MEKRIHLDHYSVNVQFLRFQEMTHNKPVLVFLHEALGSIIQWKSFPIQLCENLNLPGIVIERSGHGKSDGIQRKRDQAYLHNYTFETERVLLEVLEPNQPVLLIGHSDGGTIALLLAKSNHLNIVGGVTMAAHTFVENETLLGIQPAVEAFETGKLDGLYRIHGEKTNELFYAWADTWRADFFKNWDIRQEINGIAKPFLIIQGENDQYGTKEQVNSIVQANNFAKELFIKSCGHHPHLEKTMEVLLAIHGWYKNNFH